METTKRTFSLNGKNYEGYFNVRNNQGERFFCAFEEDVAKEILSDVFGASSWEYDTRKSRFEVELENNRSDTKDGKEQSHVINSFDVYINTSGCKRRHIAANRVRVYPVFPEWDWYIVEKQGEAEEIAAMREYTSACIEDLREHIMAVISGYANGMKTLPAKTDFLFLLKDMLNDEEHDKDGNPFSHTSIIESIIEEQADLLRDGYLMCQSCGEYVPVDDFKSENRMETKCEQTHTDAGYGDDDCFGDVTRYNTYRVCPKCGNEVLVDSMYMGTKNEKTRAQLRNGR